MGLLILMGHFTTNFVPKSDQVFFNYLCQNAVDIQNGQSCGLVYPSSINCLSRMSSNVQIGDVISGTMAAPPNVD